VTEVNDGCTYFATERRQGGVGEVDIDLARLPDAAATYAALHSRYTSNSSFAEVTGFGDAAYRTGNLLMIREGNTIVELGVNDVDGAIAPARLETLARIALPRV
jgi:hypothetical protein